jgi:hypothetical protein
LTATLPSHHLLQVATRNHVKMAADAWFAPL